MILNPGMNYILVIKKINILVYKKHVKDYVLSKPLSWHCFVRVAETAHLKWGGSDPAWVRFLVLCSVYHLCWFAQQITSRDASDGQYPNY